MFEIVQDRIGDFTQIKLIHTETGEYCSVIPEYGANLNELVLEKGRQGFALIDGHLTGSDIGDDRLYKSAQLIPFPNRIKDGAYTFNGKCYQLPVNQQQENNALHGFVCNKPFTVEKTEASIRSATVELSYSYNGNIPGYPFKFRVNLNYCLDSEQGLTCRTEIKNLDTLNIPIGNGWHPYFSLQGKVDEWVLEIPLKSLVEVDERGIPTGRRLPCQDWIRPKMIGEVRLDSCYQVDGNSKSVVVTSISDPARDVKIGLWQETGPRKYNFLQVFTPPRRNSIAIEPMTCAADAFNNGLGLIILAPGESYSASCGVQIS